MNLWTYSTATGWTMRGKATPALANSLRSKVAAMVALPEGKAPAPSVKARKVKA